MYACQNFHQVQKLGWKLGDGLVKIFNGERSKKKQRKPLHNKKQQSTSLTSRGKFSGAVHYVLPRKFSNAGL
jgi:hypothetical protein